MLDDNFIAVQNNAIRIGKLIVCGSRGWTPNGTEEDIKIYHRELIRMKMSLDEMSKIRGEDDSVIAMTHYPPFNVSLCNNEMTDLLMQYNLDAVVYGHLHGKDCRAEKLIVKDDTSFYLTSCDLIDNTLIKILEI